MNSQGIATFTEGQQIVLRLIHYYMISAVNGIIVAYSIKCTALLLWEQSFADAIFLFWSYACLFAVVLSVVRTRIEKQRKILAWLGRYRTLALRPVAHWCVFILFGLAVLLCIPFDNDVSFTALFASMIFVLLLRAFLLLLHLKLLEKLPGEPAKLSSQYIKKPWLSRFKWLRRRNPQFESILCFIELWSGRKEQDFAAPETLWESAENLYDAKSGTGYRERDASEREKRFYDFLKMAIRGAGQSFCRIICWVARAVRIYREGPVFECPHNCGLSFLDPELVCTEHERNDKRSVWTWPKTESPLFAKCENAECKRIFPTWVPTKQLLIDYKSKIYFKPKLCRSEQCGIPSSKILIAAIDPEATFEAFDAAKARIIGGLRASDGRCRTMILTNPIEEKKVGEYVVVLFDPKFASIWAGGYKYMILAPPRGDLNSPYLARKLDFAMNRVHFPVVREQKSYRFNPGIWKRIFSDFKDQIPESWFNQGRKPELFIWSSKHKGQMIEVRGERCLCIDDMSDAFDGKNAATNHVTKEELA